MNSYNHHVKAEWIMIQTHTTYDLGRSFEAIGEEQRPGADAEGPLAPLQKAMEPWVHVVLRQGGSFQIETVVF